MTGGADFYVLRSNDDVPFLRRMFCSNRLSYQMMDESVSHGDKRVSTGVHVFIV